MKIDKIILQIKLEELYFWIWYNIIDFVNIAKVRGKVCKYHQNFIVPRSIDALDICMYVSTYVLLSHASLYSINKHLCFFESLLIAKYK